MKTKIGTEVDHVTRHSDTTFNVKRSKVKVTGPLWLVVLAGQHRHPIMVAYPYAYMTYIVSPLGGPGHIVAAARLQLVQIWHMYASDAAGVSAHLRATSVKSDAVCTRFITPIPVPCSIRLAITVAYVDPAYCRCRQRLHKLATLCACFVFACICLHMRRHNNIFSSVTSLCKATPGCF